MDDYGSLVRALSDLDAARSAEMAAAMRTSAGQSDAWTNVTLRSRNFTPSTSAWLSSSAPMA